LTGWRLDIKRVNRSCPPEFRKAAVQRVVEGGRSVLAVTGSLEMSAKTLANRVARARRGEAPTQVSARGRVSELEAELTRLRQEVAKLWMEKRILKKRQRTSPRSRCEVRVDRRASRLLSSAAEVRVAGGIGQWVLRGAVEGSGGLHGRTGGNRGGDSSCSDVRHRGRSGRRRMTSDGGAFLGRPVTKKRIGRRIPRLRPY
jgi:transposase